MTSNPAAGFRTRMQSQQSGQGCVLVFAADGRKSRSPRGTHGVVIDSASLKRAMNSSIISHKIVMNTRAG